MTSSYARFQLAAAFATASTHEDSTTRARADERVRQWSRVLGAMADGTVTVGSRAPVAGLPPWVTLEVLRGGFATGEPAAGGPLADDEIALAARLQVAPRREALFAHHLTDAGLAGLERLLDTGTYRVDLPENAALLTVAWLLRAGDRAAALDLVETLAPLAARLRFTPRVVDRAAAPPDTVHRTSVGRAHAVLAHRRTPLPLARQREALTVWNPFADRVLALWRRRVGTGPVTAADSAWRTHATALLEEYRLLAAAHTLCTKHRNPKQNLAILLDATRAELDGRGLGPRRAGMVASVVRSMVAKRGEPGSRALAAVRDDQREVAQRPTYAHLAGVAAARLPLTDPDDGLADPWRYVHPVTADEPAPEGTPMPPIVERTLARTRSAPVEQLLADGTVPSGEVLAELVPGITASVVAASYPDPALGRLMAAGYHAFRRRRSLLLLDLASQVQLSELPWVQAVASHATRPSDEADAVLRRVGALYLDHFPGTVVPNPLVQEFRTLSDAAGHRVPFTEELAADIFMGRFGASFTRAAALAAGRLAGTAYADYYGIDYSVFRAPPGPAPRRSRWWAPAAAHPDGVDLADVCRARSGVGPEVSSVAANGTVIEQAQIITTHNLAALVEVGVVPTRPWTDLARDALDVAGAALARAESSPRPLSAVKDAAYAVRQALFLLSMVPRVEARDTVRAWRPATAAAALPMVRGGIEHVLDGGRFDDAGRCPRGLRLTGWTTTHPWVLPVR
ncbi:serine/threonine-protein kinase [Jatrophihabitans fulvus]